MIALAMLAGALALTMTALVAAAVHGHCVETGDDALGMWSALTAAACAAAALALAFFA